jgi:N-acetylglucosaminyl-diphospho-decaprenol L-rhamnosyltransferase
MLLSVIIVNYNVKYFLEQCLCSVREALRQSGVDSRESGVNTEVLVVDNASSDGSMEYLQPRFPFVQFIQNTVNVGFAKANNQALQQAKGKYILFLNPDTILPEDAFSACTAFMEAHTDAGALGVRMIDGSGRYLQESKRGLPTPWVALCKMSGLTRLFPTSKLFARYYLGHLPDDSTCEADALSGAFMLVRKQTLDTTGGFDEQFFMYAEDIDLSYRIQQAGYNNYYFPACTIIHFKGESTKKDARYIQLFYKAMIQFVQKHFHGSFSWIYTGILRTMIVIRQSMALPARKKTMPVWNGQEIILEQNETTSFTSIISFIQQPPYRNALVMIHAAGSGSMVGSQSKEEQGVVVVPEAASR